MVSGPHSSAHSARSKSGGRSEQSPGKFIWGRAQKGRSRQASLFREALRFCSFLNTEAHGTEFVQTLRNPCGLHSGGRHWLGAASAPHPASSHRHCPCASQPGPTPMSWRRLPPSGQEQHPWPPMTCNKQQNLGPEVTLETVGRK